MTNNLKKTDLTRGAAIIAISLIIQQFRGFIPLPSFFSGLFIGSLLNMIMVLSYQYISSRAVIASVAILLPITAYYQGFIIFVGLIPVIMLGNLSYIFLSGYYWDSFRVFLGPILKTLVILLGSYAIFYLFGFGAMFNSKVKIEVFFLMMGLLQLFAGMIGIVLAKGLEKKLPIKK